MKKVIFIETAVIICLLAGWLVWWLHQSGNLFSPLSKQPVPRPLLKYTFANLRNQTFAPSDLVFDGLHGTQDPRFATWTFHYFSDGKKVSGLANLPSGVVTGSATIDVPVIVMLHGSADSPDQYLAGFGTQPAGSVFARNGFATFAPDYLGLGTSDAPSTDSFEDRFQTYTTTLTLLVTLEQRAQKVGIWGHSNGGQIALSDLEISGKAYPTVLWNPVSEMFPYNILYYTNVYDDHGKWLRAALARFEALYDVESYSTLNFLSWINAPVLLQQGGADPWVPPKWSDQLYASLSAQLKLKNVKMEYKVYPGADHNLRPRWNEAVSDDLSFFKAHL